MPEGAPTASGRVGVERLEVAGVRALGAWPTGRSRRRPLVLVVHGLLGSPLWMADWLLDLAMGGLVAVAVEAAFAEGQPGLRSRLASRFFETLDETVQRTAEAVRRAAAALDGWRGADAGKAALVGISAGGFAILRAALGAPPRAAAAVCSGPGWLEPPAGLQEQLQAELGLRPAAAAPGASFDPAGYPGLHGAFVLERSADLAGCSVLLCVGGRDPLAPVEPARRLHRLLADAQPQAAEEGRLQLWVYPSLGHRVTGPMKQRVAGWIRWMLAG